MCVEGLLRTTRRRRPVTGRSWSRDTASSDREGSDGLNLGTIMRNAKLWPVAFLGLLWWPGLVRPQGPGPDETNAQRAKALLEQGVRRYRAKDFAAAAPLFLEAARLGNADAQLQIGWHY